jgi:hypothetical protein
MNIHMILNPSLFALGNVIATPGAIDTLQTHQITPISLLSRHAHGDRGDLCLEDKKENALALREGYRLFSAYQISPRDMIWIITEADRSVTTLLLPEEY